MRRFPRLSPSGLLLLAATLLAIRAAFNSSLYGPALGDGRLAAASPILLNGTVAAASLLNVLSHAAVVLGALDDAYVLSILVGVGFDVATRILQLAWWMGLSAVAFGERELSEAGEEGDTRCAATVAFLAALSIAYACHMAIHARALRMNASYERLEGVLRSALNNLRGIPGELFGDHIFAYTDLGTHLAPLCLSAQLLLQQRAISTGCWILGLLVVLSAGALSWVPINDDGKGGLSIVQLGSGDDTVDCSCPACTARSQSTEKKSAFACSRRHGVCRLWLHSFGELLTVLEMAKAKRER